MLNDMAHSTGAVNLKAEQPLASMQVGSPVLELFLKKDAAGQLQRQATALSISPEVLAKMHSSIGEAAPMLPYIDSWPFQKHVRRDTPGLLNS